MVVCLVSFLTRGMGQQVKNYLSVADSICFFSEKTGLSFNLADISDFVVRGRLTPCFRYDGQLAWEDAHYSKYRRDTAFHGYLTTYELQDEFLRIAEAGKTTITGRVFIKEMIRTMGIPEHTSIDHKSFYVLDDQSFSAAALIGDSNVAQTAIRLFKMELLFSDIIFPYTEVTSIIEGKNSQPEKDKEPNTAPTGHPPAEPITTLQAIGIMAELLAAENGYKYRKGESNVNAKAIGMAVANRAKIRFGDDVRGFESFNKKISEGLKALEDL